MSSSDQVEKFRHGLVVEAKRIDVVACEPHRPIPNHQWNPQKGVVQQLQYVHAGRLAAWGPSTHVSVNTWDPTICGQCGGSMSEPNQLGPRWVNHCLNCGLSREVPNTAPFLKQHRQQMDLQAYPELLQSVGPERPWVFAQRKVAITENFTDDSGDLSYLLGHMSKFAVLTVL